MRKAAASGCRGATPRRCAARACAPSSGAALRRPAMHALGRTRNGTAVVALHTRCFVGVLHHTSRTYHYISSNQRFGCAARNHTGHAISHNLAKRIKCMHAPIVTHAGDYHERRESPALPCSAPVRPDTTPGPAPTHMEPPPSRRGALTVAIACLPQAPQTGTTARITS